MHPPEALFPCILPGCGKAFHRADLLQRHEERHDLDSAADASGHISQMAQVAVSSNASSSSGNLSIGSLIHPQHEHRYNVGTSAFGGFTRQAVHYVPGFHISDEFTFNYTPESSQSPVHTTLINGHIPFPWVPSSDPPSTSSFPLNDDTVTRHCHAHLAGPTSAPSAEPQYVSAHAQYIEAATIQPSISDGTVDALVLQYTMITKDELQHRLRFLHLDNIAVNLLPTHAAIHLPGRISTG